MNNSIGKNAAVTINENRGQQGDVRAEVWDQARDWVRDLRELEEGAPVSAETVRSLAARWNVSRATVWRRIRAHGKSGNLSGLLPRRPGRKPGVAAIEAAADQMIRTVARRWWRQTENATIAEIEPAVIKDCERAGLRPPSRATIARRLEQLRQDPENFSGE